MESYRINLVKAASASLSEHYSALARTAISVNPTTPLKFAIPDIDRAFKLGRKDEHFIRKIEITPDGKTIPKEKLNLFLSLYEQSIGNNECLAIIPHDTLKDETLASITRFTMEGWLQKSSRKNTGKPTNLEKRWFVLKDSFLYYFEKKASNLKPKGVIDLQTMSISFDATSCGFKLQKQESFKQGALEYGLVAESPFQAREWIKQIRKDTYPGVNSRVFGVHLERFVNRATTRKDIPEVLIKCTQFLVNKGLQLEGIFRVPAGTSEMEVIRDMFDMGESVDLYTATKDPHVVAGVFKSFFRDLPNPLIPFAYYDELVYSRDLNIQKLASVICALPLPNGPILQYLIDFLRKVLTFTRQNRMDAQGLATIFAPNLLRPREESANTLMGENSVVSKIILMLIENDLPWPQPVPEFEDLTPMPRESSRPVSQMYGNSKSGTFYGNAPAEYGLPPSLGAPPPVTQAPNFYPGQQAQSTGYDSQRSSFIAPPGPDRASFMMPSSGSSSNLRQSQYGAPPTQSLPAPMQTYNSPTTSRMTVTTGLQNIPPPPLQGFPTQQNYGYQQNNYQAQNTGYQNQNYGYEQNQGYGLPPPQPVYMSDLPPPPPLPFDLPPPPPPF